MIKQELNILQEQGYMNNMTDKRELIKAALLDCEFSLRESHDIIYKLRHDHHKSAKVLDNINISLTILKLMKEAY